MPVRTYLRHAFPLGMEPFSSFNLLNFATSFQVIADCLLVNIKTSVGWKRQYVHPVFYFTFLLLIVYIFPVNIDGIISVIISAEILSYVILSDGFLPLTVYLALRLTLPHFVLTLSFLLVVLKYF